MMGWYGGGMGPLQWLGMSLFWLILLGLIVWLVARLLPGSGGSPIRHTSESHTGESPLEILDRRLASGEIDLDSWQAHRAALRGTQGHSK